MTSGSEGPDLRPLRERLDELHLDESATLEEAQERLYRAGLTDGLPVIPPTRAHTAARLAPCHAGEES